MRQKYLTQLLFGSLLLIPFLFATGAQEPGSKEGGEKKELLPAGKGQKPFDVTRRAIPLREIQGGGPPRDGIPALTEPELVTAAEADRFLKKNDRVMGVLFNGKARAYPIKILNWHEAVNDRAGSLPFLVTW